MFACAAVGIATYADATQPKWNAVRELAVGGKKTPVRCMAAPADSVDETLLAALTAERNATYAELERTTARLMHEEIARQGIPMDAIADESRSLRDMSDVQAEQIRMLAGELGEITAQLMHADSETTGRNDVLAGIAARIRTAKLSRRKTRIEKKMTELISVRTELESGIEKNRRNMDGIRTAIMTAFKTPAMAELERRLDENAAARATAEAYCKEQAALKRAVRTRR